MELEFKEGDPIEVETPHGWASGEYVGLVSGEHVVSCSELWYGPIRIPRHRFRARTPKPSEAPTAPRFVISRGGGIAFIAACYLLLVIGAAALLTLIEWTQGYDDNRNIDATVIFALVVALPFGRSLRSAMRRPRLPGYPLRVPRT